MPEKEVAKVEDYFGKIGVVALKVTEGKIKIGDTLHYKGHTTDFSEKVTSMQKDHKEIEEAKKGDEIGIKTKERVRKNDKVYLVPEE